MHLTLIQPIEVGKFRIVFDPFATARKRILPVRVERLIRDNEDVGDGVHRPENFDKIPGRSSSSILVSRLVNSSYGLVIAARYFGLESKYEAAWALAYFTALFPMYADPSPAVAAYVGFPVDEITFAPATNPEPIGISFASTLVWDASFDA